MAKIRDVLKLLHLNGWVQTAQRGSHRQFEHPVKAGKVTVSGHESQDLDPKTYGSILRQAGLLR